MKEFKKYSKITNCTSKLVDYIGYNGDMGIECVVTEKIHGGNFSIIVERDDPDFKFARRKAVLKDDEKFYNWKKAIEPKFPLIQKMVMAMWLVYPEAQKIQLFGELFGGTYVHDEVMPDASFSTVQTGVQYAPFQDFLIFDVVIDDEYLDWKDVRPWIAQFYGLFVEELFVGPLDQCLKYENEFQTTIPARYGLPDIEGNTCEGVVIKPLVEKRFNDGKRFIIKNKNDKFAEVASHKKSTTKGTETPEIVQKQLDIASQYINDNRFNAVLSKLSEITKNDFSLLMKEFSNDVLEDFGTDNLGWNMGMSTDDEKCFKKRLNKEIVNFIRPRFLELI